MSWRFTVSVLLLAMGPVSIVSGCQTWGPGQVRGTAVGGLSGGVIGAALGSNKGKTAEGALIGGVAGAILGNALGGQADAADARYQMAQDQRYADTMRSAVSYDQVIQMVQHGLGDEVIANQIHNQGITHRPTTQDIILLRSRGVPDRVIAAMQSAWIPAERPRGTTRVYQVEPVYPPPAVIIESYRPYPSYYCPPPYYRVPHHHHRDSHFGFSIGF